MGKKRSKSSNSTLNPIIILSFILIGLLLVIISILSKANISSNLKTTAYICKPTHETARIPENNNTYDTLTVTVQLPIRNTFEQRKAAAYDLLRSEYCHSKMPEPGTQHIPCTDPLCKSDQNYPDCEATIVRKYIIPGEVTENTPPGFTSQKFTAPRIYAILRRACTPKETPEPYPHCTISGPRSDSCAPPAIAIDKASNTATGDAVNTYNGEGRYEKTNDQMITEARNEAIEKAKKPEDLEKACNTLLDEKGLIITQACAAKNELCAPGCGANGKPTYQPPAILNRCNPPVLVDKEMDNDIYPNESHITYVKYSVTCEPECKLEQICSPEDTPTPSF